MHYFQKSHPCIPLYPCNCTNEPPSRSPLRSINRTNIISSQSSHPLPRYSPTTLYHLALPHADAQDRVTATDQIIPSLRVQRLQGQSNHFVPKVTPCAPRTLALVVNDDCPSALSWDIKCFWVKSTPGAHAPSLHCFSNIRVHILRTSNQLQRTVTPPAHLTSRRFTSKRPHSGW